MTVSTIFSSVSLDEASLGPTVSHSVVNTGALVTQRLYTLTVSPASGWAKANIMEGTDGVNYPRGLSIFCAPGAGTTIDQVIAVEFPAQYFTGEVVEVSPGATCTLTVTY